MNRYNKAIYTNSMKQASDGEWVRYADFEEYQAEYRLLLNESRELLNAKTEQLEREKRWVRTLRVELEYRQRRLSVMTMYSVWITILAVGYFIGK